MRKEVSEIQHGYFHVCVRDHFYLLIEEICVHLHSYILTKRFEILNFFNKDLCGYSGSKFLQKILKFTTFKTFL